MWVQNRLELYDYLCTIILIFILIFIVIFILILTSLLPIAYYTFTTGGHSTAVASGAGKPFNIVSSTLELSSYVGSTVLWGLVQTLEAVAPWDGSTGEGDDDKGVIGDGSGCVRKEEEEEEEEEVVGKEYVYTAFARVMADWNENYSCRSDVKYQSFGLQLLRLLMGDMAAQGQLHTLAYYTASVHGLSGPLKEPFLDMFSQQLKIQLSFPSSSEATAHPLTTVNTVFLVHPVLKDSFTLTKYLAINRMSLESTLLERLLSSLTDRDLAALLVREQFSTDGTVINPYLLNTARGSDGGGEADVYDTYSIKLSSRIPADGAKDASVKLGMPRPPPSASARSPTLPHAHNGKDMIRKVNTYDSAEGAPSPRTTLHAKVTSGNHLQSLLVDGTYGYFYYHLCLSLILCGHYRHAAVLLVLLYKQFEVAAILILVEETSDNAHISLLDNVEGASDKAGRNVLLLHKYNVAVAHLFEALGWDSYLFHRYEHTYTTDTHTPTINQTLSEDNPTTNNTTTNNNNHNNNHTNNSTNNETKESPLKRINNTTTDTNTDILHTHIHELIRQFKTIRAMNEYSAVQVAGKRLDACIQEWRSKNKQH